MIDTSAMSKGSSKYMSKYHFRLKKNPNF